MAFFNADSPGFWRFSSRIALAILLPALLAAWLLHSASVQEESIHSRNTRWLAQMGENLRKRIEHNQNIVASVAKDLRESSADKDSVLSAVGNLKLVEADCAKRKPLEVRYEGGVPKITFVNSDPPAPTCLEADLGTLVGKAIRADAFDSVILADRQGGVMYQSEGGETRLTDVKFLFDGSAPESSSFFSSLKGDSGAAKKAGARAERFRQRRDPHRHSTSHENHRRPRIRSFYPACRPGSGAPVRVDRPGRAAVPVEALGARRPHGPAAVRAASGVGGLAAAEALVHVAGCQPAPPRRRPDRGLHLNPGAPAELPVPLPLRDCPRKPRDRPAALRPLPGDRQGLHGRAPPVRIPVAGARQPGDQGES